MNLIFFDLPAQRTNLKPFTLTRPVAGLRVGILTLEEKWQRRLAPAVDIQRIAYLTEAYLQLKYPLELAPKNLLINASVCPSVEAIERIATLAEGQALRYQETWVATYLSQEDLTLENEPYDYLTLAQAVSDRIDTYETIELSEALTNVRHTWDIFLHNAEQIEQDYALLTYSRTSYEPDDPYTRLYRPDRIFIEEGVSVRAAVINAEAGPVYIGKQATVHENAVIKGPCAVLEGAHVNIGSKIREATTIGPRCKVGGEVKNTVFFANSNKGHEGFVGNSVVGEWCNFGADTNTSNLKNNYQYVRLWNYGQRAYEDTGQQFCGLMMGDHSKCSINTMFNTGTVVGVFANVFGTGFPAKFIPSFTWGGVQEANTYHFDKALKVYERVLKRRNKALSAGEVAILKHVYQHRSGEFPD